MDQSASEVILKILTFHQITKLHNHSVYSPKTQTKSSIINKNLNNLWFFYSTRKLKNIIDTRIIFRLYALDLLQSK